MKGWQQYQREVAGSKTPRRRFLFTRAASGISQKRFLGDADRSARRRRERATRRLCGLAEHEPNIVLRLQMLSAGLLVFALLICLRLYDLQRDENSKWLKLASRQHRSSVQVQGVRGTIFDASGRILATSVRSLSVGANPREIPDIGLAAKELSGVLGIPEANIKEKLQTDKPFVWVQRGLPLTMKENIEQIKIRGVRDILEFRRYYPQGRLAGAVLGRVNRDGDGLAGIELKLDTELRAPNFKVAVKRDARGKILTAAAMPETSESFSSMVSRLSWHADGLLPALMGEEPSTVEEVEIRKEGNTAVLSIDSISQAILEEEFAKGTTDAKAKRTFGFVMDAMSGEILALSQTPMFDPNQFENVSPEDLRNSVIQDSFEPGSTMKPLVAAVALDTGKVKENEIIDCEKGEYRVGPHLIRDVHPEDKLSLRDVLVRSSNICTAKLGQRLGPERLHDTLKQYGFGSRTELELPGEAAGILRPVSSWAEVDVATHAFGQGVSVTAMQLVRAYAVLANGGMLVRPTLLRRKPDEVAETERVISAKTAATISRMIAGVTEDEHGTGQKAKIPGVTVYGKTGTAQKARAGGRGYETNKVLASFVGYVDGRQIGLNRNLVMLVAVDEPGVMPRWGGAVAAPVFQRAMSRILSHLLAVELKNTQSAAVHEVARKVL